MRVKNKKLERRLRIRRRIRKAVSGTAERPRLAVYKSNQCIYAQLIDDEKGHTLVTASSAGLGDKNINREKAKKVGERLAEKARAKDIHGVVFDRSGYIYHGKVRALAEGAREKGLKF